MFLSRRPKAPLTNVLRQEALLRQLRQGLEPKDDVRERIRSRLRVKITMPNLLDRAREELTPNSTQQQGIWERVLQTVAPQGRASLWDRLRSTMNPPEFLSTLLFERVTARVAQKNSRRHVSWSLKWAAAIAAILLVVRISPVFFLAPHSIAESPVLVVPTRGSVSVLMGGTWQQVDQEMILKRSALLQTGESEATIVLHDNVLRMAAHTTVALHDLSIRPHPVENDRTLTLHAGKIWVQGLIPASLQGISVATPQGLVIVHEGSVSIALDSKDGKGQSVDVRTWDRKVDVERGEQNITLISGQRIELWQGNAPLMKNITSSSYDDPWVEENLRRDAVHRHDIVELQTERRAASAGILPTSHFYSVKRVAEAVDVLLTFDEQERTKKRIAQADTRLNEAAALIQEGNPEQAAFPLTEYKNTLLAVATGSGGDALVHSLLEQHVAEAAVDTTAALPGDDTYAIKEAVLQTSAELPETGVTQEDIQGNVLLDQLSALNSDVQTGDVQSVQEEFEQLQPHLSLILDASLSAESRREAQASLQFLVEGLEEFAARSGTGNDALLANIRQYLPAAAASEPVLTEEQIDAIVQTILGRIYSYAQPRPQYNQLLLEFHALDGNPDQGRILRKLFHALPEHGLAQYVKTEFKRLRDIRADGQ